MRTPKENPEPVIFTSYQEVLDALAENPNLEVYFYVADWASTNERCGMDVCATWARPEGDLPSLVKDPSFVDFCRSNIIPFNAPSFVRFRNGRVATVVLENGFADFLRGGE